MDYPDDESSGIHSLDNLVSSWMKKHKTTTVVLPDAVEMQLDESLHSIESAEESVATPAPPLEASGSVQQSSVQVRDSTVSLEDEEQEEPKKPRRNGRRPYIMGGILLALVCIAAIVVVSMMAPDKSTPSATVSNNIKDGNEQDNHGDVNTPTGAVLTREESLTKIAQGVSSQEALDTPDSPQARALEWLIEHDAAKVTPSAGRSEDEQVQERYILAVFYYATGGVDWFDSFYFLSQNHVCNWKNLDFGMGVQCEDGSPTVTGLKFGKFIVCVFCNDGAKTIACTYTDTCLPQTHDFRSQQSSRHFAGWNLSSEWHEELSSHYEPRLDRFHPFLH